MHPQNPLDPRRVAPAAVAPVAAAGAPARRVRPIAAAVALLLALAGAPLPRPAAPPALGAPDAQVAGPTLRLSPATASPGDTIQLAAANFLPGRCLATLLWDGRRHGTYRIRDGGAMDARFVVPPGSTLASHRLTLMAEAPCLTSDNEFGQSASADLRVAAIGVAAKPRPDLAADLARADRLVVVRAVFDDRDTVVSHTVSVTDGLLPARAVRPDLVRLTARDVNGAVVDEVPGWHPAWVSEWTGEGEHHHLAQYPAEGRFIVPFQRNLGTLEVVDVPRQERVATIDLAPAIAAYCDLRPDDPACVPPGPTLWIAPAAGTVKATQTMTLEVRAHDIKALYGVQLTLRFDPRLVEVVDQDGATPGVQIEPGAFPPPDAVLRNTASNAGGTVEYVATLQGEKPGVSGGGTVATIVLRGKAAGTSPLAFEQVVLSDPQSRAIEVASQPGQVTVTDLTPQDTPITIAGRIVLERRPTSGGARVCVESTCATTAPDGSYTLRDVLPRLLRVTHPSYLASERAVPAGAADVPPVTLLGGDVNQDDRIHTQDVVAMGGGWGQRPGGTRWLEALDITDDDVVDVLDAVAVQFNLGRRAPGPWPDALARRDDRAPEDAADAGGARQDAEIDQAGDEPSTVVALMPETLRVPGRGVPASLDIAVADVSRLFGYHVMVKYDRAMLRVRDANPRPSAPGVQVRVGDFLDVENLLVAENRVDEEEGLVFLMVTQTYPATGRTGSGVLGTIDFDVLAEGTSRVKFEVVELYDDAWPEAVRIAAAHRGADVVALTDRFLNFAPWSER